MSLMNESEKERIKKQFKDRIDSLRHDANIAFPSVNEGAFFPIVMYIFATIDYFSSYYYGWNDLKEYKKKHGANPPEKNQTIRMVKFLNRFMNYQEKDAFVAINMFRHKLMHTAEPRLVEDEVGNKYDWEIGDRVTNNLSLVQKNPKEYRITISVMDFIDDLENGVFGSKGYYTLLRDDEALQQKWKDCYDEFSNYRIDLTKI